MNSSSKKLNLGRVLLISCVLLFMYFPEYYCTMEEISIEDTLEYPIIVNFEVDKAVFIVPYNGCHVVSDRHLAKALIYQRRYNVLKEDRKTVEEIIELCELYQNATIDGTELLVGIRNRFLIYPGTKWCGAGSTALNDSDLGYYQETDACCRDHDGCEDYVIGFSCHQSNGLCNKSPFTRSNCACDNKFRNCLQKSNETASRRIGILYFTIFGLQCFREDYPIITCLEYGGFLNIHCQKYLLDYEKEKMYQFFDSPKYSSNITITEIENTTTASQENNNNSLGSSRDFYHLV